MKKSLFVEGIFDDANLNSSKMGNKQNEEVDNPNFNMAAYNQRVQQAAVYQQHATLNPNMAQFHMAEHKKKFEIE
jgi:uncharacterized protein YccT (UPF0319 family)